MQPKIEITIDNATPNYQLLGSSILAEVPEKMFDENKGIDISKRKTRFEKILTGRLMLMSSPFGFSSPDTLSGCDSSLLEAWV